MRNAPRRSEKWHLEGGFVIFPRPMDFDRDFGVNQVFVEDQYDRWRNNPAAVSPEWQQYFARLHGLPTTPLFQTSAWSQPVAPAAGNGNGKGHAVETPANGFDQALLHITPE